MSDFSAFAIEQVSKSGRRFMTKDDHILIQCPTHAGGNENRPSRKINLSNPRFKPLESYCYVCHDDQKRLTWNELAALTNMAPLRGDGGEESDSDEQGEQLWLELPPATDFYGIEAEGMSHMPWKGSWRGINAKLIRKLQATLVDSRDEPRIYFPICVDGVEVGNTQCVVDASHEESSKIKYLHSGKWTGWTLYPIDVAFPMAEKLGYILIVEGLRDALNLIQYGVPAVCIWGTNGWTNAKRDVLLDLGVKIVVAMDGDDAGITARDKIASSLKRAKHPHSVINFEEGQDPGTLTRADVEEIAAMFGKKRLVEFKLKINSPRALNDNIIVKGLLEYFRQRRAS